MCPYCDLSENHTELCHETGEVRKWDPVQNPSASKAIKKMDFIDIIAWHYDFLTGNSPTAAPGEGHSTIIM